MTALLTANDTRGAYPPSYYAATANALDPLPPLNGDITADVCIIGGGYTGLSAALHLSERGYNVVLVEAHRVGWGASGRNGGQVDSGQRRAQSELETLLGRDHAKQLWSLAEEAKCLVKSLIAEHQIACDLKPGVIQADHKARYVEHTRREVEKLQEDYGYQLIRALTKEEIRAALGTDSYHGGALDEGAGHLHPLNYALGLAKAARRSGARLFERSQVLRYEQGKPCRVILEGGSITAEFVILACNGYLDKLDGKTSSRTMPINNFIIATEPLSEDQAHDLIRDDVAVADSKFVINYYRLSADRRLLFGGGETYSYSFPEDIKAYVRPHMLEVYPQLETTAIDYGWGGTLAITMNRLPYFAQLSPNVLTAAGYSGQGVALATLAGKILAEAVAGTAERMDVMARIPTQPFPGGSYLRWPLLVLSMFYYSLRDKL
ncbi:MAG: NAD(P)/FAD-dependent oxidoreductase [Geminicoccaceae bacterium]